MNNQSFVRKLENMRACAEAIEWIKQHGGTDQECWDDCKRGDYMDWYLLKSGVDGNLRYMARKECPSGFWYALESGICHKRLSEKDLKILSKAADVFRLRFPKIPR